MVRGIDQFRTHFKDFKDRYVLIGGAACYLALDEAGLEFRATKDIDIVLCLEALDAEFARAIWDFINSGMYKNIQKSTGNDQTCFHAIRPSRCSLPCYLS